MRELGGTPEHHDPQPDFGDQAARNYDPSDVSDLLPTEIDPNLQPPSDTGEAPPDGATPNSSKDSADRLEQVNGTRDQTQPSDKPDADTAWTNAQRGYVDHFADRALRALNELDLLAQQGKQMADRVPQEARQDVLDLAEDLRVEGALARERVARLRAHDRDAEAATAQVVAMYEALKGQVDDVTMRLDEWTGSSDAQPEPTGQIWLRKISSQIKSLLRRLASVLAGMAHPKEWVLKGEIGWFLTKGQIEIKFGRP